MNKQEMDDLLSREILTVQEVMPILKLSYNTIYKMIADGRLEGFNTNPGGENAQWRVWTYSLKRLMGIKDEDQVPV